MKRSTVTNRKPLLIATTRRSVVRVGGSALVLGAIAAGANRLVAPPLTWESTPDGDVGAGSGGPDQEFGEFVGVTTDGTVVPDLFAVEATGLSAAPIVEAATAFLASLADDQRAPTLVPTTLVAAPLTDDQRAATLFAVDDDEWRMWSNVDGYARQGVSLREMDDAQRAAGYALVEASLSVVGYEKVDATIKLNHTEGELMGDFDSFDEDLYWFTVMGEPSATDPWGWQIDGHHLVVNVFVLGDQVVMNPVFMGAEPTVAPEGTDYAGLAVLQPEQDKGLAFVRSLDADQQAVAIVSPSKSGEDLKAGAFSDNAVVPDEGIVATDLTDDQQTELLALIEEWVNNLRDEHAALKMEEVRSHLGETHFSWIGGTGDDAVFYYRIQSPVLLIEFDHQAPGPLGRSSDYYGGATGPQRAHVHSVVRTPNGNDYGKDLLAQHYATSAHHAGGALAGALALGAVTTPTALRRLLPPRYRGSAPISSAPMGSAPLVYDGDGRVAWDAIWGDFCDLALAGGPPHRPTVLQPGAPDDIVGRHDAYDAVVAEIARGLTMVTGWPVDRDVALGWVGLSCPDEAAADWMLMAVSAENIASHREGATLLLPAGPDFRVEGEVKNVVTAIAKTHHYWTEHAADEGWLG